MKVKAEIEGKLDTFGSILMKMSAPLVHHQPLSILGLKLFFVLLLVCLLSNNKIGPVKLFTNHHGRAHRLAGLFHLIWLLVGTFYVVNNNSNDDGGNLLLESSYYYYQQWHIKCLVYDFILGISGIITTLSAASSFPHRHVINRSGESGTLSKMAMVTQSEMIEHSFYQGLNLWQAMYLHLITCRDHEHKLLNSSKSTSSSLFAWRFLMLFAVTLPWAIRKRFPVNSFSANWKGNNGTNDKNNTENKNRIKLGTEKESKSLWLINAMYRFKKWQYIFYKHTILHGLNVSVAVLSSTRWQQGMALTSQWRIFYLLLNTSYVMEFFLQSLVRRGVLNQRFMMVLNGLLMASSSLAAMDSNVLGQVRIEAALLSLTLNFSNRGHDILNTMATFVLIQLMIQYNFIA
jgi:hypothetical protein